MPIRPDQRGVYPPTWSSEIVPRIRARADHRCERCGVPHRALGWRDGEGLFHMVAEDGTMAEVRRLNAVSHEHRHMMIVCTVAHLNHDPADCREDNLLLLCQRCHNRHDVAHRVATRRRTRCERSGQQSLWGDDDI